jgi:hypothetical protein
MRAYSTMEQINDNKWEWILGYISGLHRAKELLTSPRE